MLPAAVLVIVNKFVEEVLRIPSVNVRVAEDSVTERETPFGLLTVKLFRMVTLEGRVIPVAVPPKTIVDEAVVERLFGVPAIAGPLRVRVLAPTAKVPPPRVRRAPTIEFPPRVLVPEPEILRLLYATAAHVCTPFAFHSTVPVPAVNVPAAPITLPPIFKRLEPPFNVPFVLVHAPVNVCVKPEPRLRVPPIPLIVNPPPLTLPVNVAVPVVFVIDTKPVVLNPLMFCATMVFAITIGELPAVKVPPFTKLPPKVN